MLRTITLLLSVMALMACSGHQILNEKEKNGGGILSPIKCPDNADCGQPLYLTPMLRAGRIRDAQEAAKVTFPGTAEFQQVQHVQSYSGFFTVNESVNSNMFFWFFLAEKNTKEAPILLYLQGGPGASFEVDIFQGNGPFQAGSDSKLAPGPNGWTRSMNVLYIDNPVGAGFSFTQNISGYAKTQEDYTSNLYESLTQFFQLFPDYAKNSFFITGVSYGGKFVPALAYEIHQKNPTATAKINLEGIAIGNGLVNPSMQWTYSKFLYGIDLIDLETKTNFEQQEEEIKELIKMKKYSDAYGHLGNLVFSTFPNLTGVNPGYYSKTNEEYQASVNEILATTNKFLEMPAVRKSIHVGSQEFWVSNSTAESALNDDVPQSIAPKLEVLMDNYRVLLYSGQFDVLCNYRLMIDYIMDLKWKGAAEYRNATRQQWLVNGELAGFSKSAGNFTEVLVRNAGHVVTWHQPAWGYELMVNLTKARNSGKRSSKNSMLWMIPPFLKVSYDLKLL